MKKVRIEIRDGSPGRRFWLFSTSLDLWEWIRSCFAEPNSSLERTPRGALEIVLRPGDFMEAEWWGCEIMQEGEGWRHLNLIRLAEVHPSKNSAGNVIDVHIGWVIDTIVPMCDYEDENILVGKIKNDEAMLDLDELFKQRGVEL